jgi:hypothetical protein
VSISVQPKATEPGSGSHTGPPGPAVDLHRKRDKGEPARRQPAEAGGVLDNRDGGRPQRLRAASRPHPAQDDCAATRRLRRQRSGSRGCRGRVWIRRLRPRALPGASAVVRPRCRLRARRGSARRGACRRAGRRVVVRGVEVAALGLARCRLRELELGRGRPRDRLRVERMGKIDRAPERRVDGSRPAVPPASARQGARTRSRPRGGQLEPIDLAWVSASSTAVLSVADLRTVTATHIPGGSEHGPHADGGGSDQIEGAARQVGVAVRTLSEFYRRRVSNSWTRTDRRMA